MNGYNLVTNCQVKLNTNNQNYLIEVKDNCLVNFQKMETK